MRSVPVEKLKEYAVEDADVTFQLKNVFEPRIKDRRTWKILHEILKCRLSVFLQLWKGIGVKLDLEDLKAITSKSA